MGKFEIKYEVENGYVVGGSRLHSFTISSSHIDDDDEEEGLRDFYKEEVRWHFDQYVTMFGINEDEFVDWAKEVIAKRQKGKE